ncbi:MAG: hypothetical protein JNL69_00395 [Bacteroidia bacterium]|nr:hypothetical protein [Bacteroidia bacterium]
MKKFLYVLVLICFLFSSCEKEDKYNHVKVSGTLVFYCDQPFNPVEVSMIDLNSWNGNEYSTVIKTTTDATSYYYFLLGANLEKSAVPYLFFHTNAYRTINQTPTIKNTDSRNTQNMGSIFIYGHCEVYYNFSDINAIGGLDSVVYTAVNGLKNFRSINRSIVFSNNFAYQVSGFGLVSDRDNYVELKLYKNGNLVKTHLDTIHPTYPGQVYSESISF